MKQSRVGQAGVTVADCESVSRQLQHVLEVEASLRRLEVSSPGLDRRLKKHGTSPVLSPRSPVRLRRRSTAGAIRRTVRAVEGERVELEFEGSKVDFEMADLDRARLLPKL